MQSIHPKDELQRIAAVHRYDILDTPPDGSFDRITALAARLFGVPISIISIVDHDRIWFKSHHGLDVEQIGRDPGLCASAILSNDPHILGDAKVDPRSLANSLVAGDFGLRFYVGVPLRTHDGYNLGTLCVIDREPRDVNDQQVADLQDLASLVMDQMELRLSARKAHSQADIMAREIDHRVRNSLQFVSSLLAMQGRSPGLTREAADQLSLAANRVAAVARVHSVFSEAADEVPCIPFLRRLCADLASIVDKNIEVHGDEGAVPSNRIQPIGLLVNELVTNAAKHSSTTIAVTCHVANNLRKISVCDDGDGLPAEFDPEKTKGLGMKVVNILAAQLGGHLTIQSNPVGRGACFHVTFPA